MIKNLRKFLKENNIDYLLVNSTDEFLVEYNELSNSARFAVTGFSGSTGDVLLSQKDVFQFYSAEGTWTKMSNNILFGEKQIKSVLFNSELIVKCQTFVETMNKHSYLQRKVDKYLPL